MARYRLTNIAYETDGETVDLPTTIDVEVDDALEGDEAIAEAIDIASDRTGWLISGTDAERIGA